MAVTIRAFVREVGERLDGQSDPGVQDWWDRYLKGAAVFRGVRMADVRKTVRAMVVEHGLADAPAARMLQLAHGCMRERPTEDKLAGVLLLAEHALDRIDLSHVPDLAKPFEWGDLADWNVVDWTGVKLLGPFVSAGSDVKERAHAIAAWRDADGLWQRRAAAVAFVNHAAEEHELFRGFHSLLIEVCEANVRDEARWSQTSVGWLLRDLSRHGPGRRRVERFLAAHPELSAEARKNATKYL
ncbi:MAG: DNA alkylation repair protein [Planctomycetota bacterium]